MALHTDLQVYKIATDLLSLATDITRNMPRDIKVSLGNKIQAECIDMLVLIARANASANKVPHITALLEHQHVAQLLLRLSFDKKFISQKHWSAALELSNRVGRQAGGWLKASRMTAPAA
jgi:hypothetical protein